MMLVTVLKQLNLAAFSAVDILMRKTSANLFAVELRRFAASSGRQSSASVARHCGQHALDSGCAVRLRSRRRSDAVRQTTSHDCAQGARRGENVARSTLDLLRLRRRQHAGALSLVGHAREAGVE